MLAFVLLFLFVNVPLIQGHRCLAKRDRGDQKVITGQGLVGSAIGAVGSAAGTVCPFAKRVVLPRTKSKCGCGKKRGRCNCASILPAFLSAETYIDYIKRVFCSKQETTSEYFDRIFRRYEKETHENYIKRIDEIFCQFPWLQCRDNLDYWKITGTYYKLKYGKIEKIFPCMRETEDDYFKRILNRMKNEEFESYIRRMDCVFHAYPKLIIWRRIQFDKNSKDWYYFRDVDYCHCIKPSLNIRENFDQVYARKECEKDDDYTYFKRICDRKSGESDDDYVERLTRIRTKFGNLSLWCSSDYITLIKEYYIILFRRKDKESEKDYYKRITCRDDKEDIECYIRRMTTINNLLDYLPLWCNEEYLSLTKPYYEVIYAKQPSEDNIKYLQRITSKPSTEDLDKYIKRMNIVRCVCKDTDLFYNTKYLPYIKCYYENYYKKCSDNDESWFTRIFKRSYKETDEEYVRRISMVLSVQRRVSSFTISEKYLNFASEYYRLFYKRKPGEETKDWLKRIITKDESETEETFKTKLRYLGNAFPDCKTITDGVIEGKINSVEDKIISDQNNTPGEKTGPQIRAETTVKAKTKNILTPNTVEKETEVDQHKTSDQEEESDLENDCDCKETLTEEYIKTTFVKTEEEDSATYNTRVTTILSTISPENYDTALKMIYKCFPHMSFWYDIKCIDLVKEFYTDLYAKLSSEDEETRFRRIVTKATFETDEECTKRVEILHQLFPNLSLWCNEKYYETLTKKHFQIIYKQCKCENDKTYYQRICTRITDESDSTYVRRMNLVLKTLNTLKLWCNVDHVDVLKPFYSLKYSREAEESEEAYFKRLVNKELCDTSTNEYAKRIHIVHLMTINSELWYTECNFEKLTKNYYENYYKKEDKESCESWLTKVMKQMAGECEKNTLRRIQIIKKFSSSCGCWSQEIIGKLGSSMNFPEGFMINVKSSLFGTTLDYEKKSSSSSCSKETSSEESAEELLIKKRCVC